MIFTTKEIPYPHYGSKSYRIEYRIPKHRFGQAYQRHIWTNADGTIEYGDWIPTPVRYTEEELRKKGWVPLEDE